MVYKKPNSRSKITQKSKAAIDLDQNRKTNTKPSKLKINTFPYHHISAVVGFFTRSINLVRILCIFVKSLTRNLMHFSAIKLEEALIKECWQRSVLTHSYLLVHSHLSYRCMHHNAEAHFLQCGALREGKYEHRPSPTPNASKRKTATNTKTETVSAEAEKKADLKMVKTGKLKVNDSL